MAMDIEKCIENKLNDKSENDGFIQKSRVVLGMQR